MRARVPPFSARSRGGAALVRDGEAWVLADEQPGRALGPAMAWARQQGASRVNVVAEADDGLAGPPSAGLPLGAGGLARRGPLAGGRRRPSRCRTVPQVDPRVLDLAPLIVEGGAEPVVEHGVLVGEVAGLEVCRAVVDPDTDAVRLEVGVGVHDREAFQLLHGDVPPVEALRRGRGQGRAATAGPAPTRTPSTASPPSGSCATG